MTDDKLFYEIREMLAGVFSRDEVESIKGTDSFVADLNADSLDFVEILHLVERKFGVKINGDEIILGGAKWKAEEIFVDGRLTDETAALLKEALPAKADQIVPEMGRLAFFTLFTVNDLVALIAEKMKEAGN